MVDPRREPLPDYATLAATLARCGLPQGPAEVHGFALGLRIANVTEPRKAWREELYSAFDPDDVLAKECRAALDRLFDAVFSEPEGGAMQLSLLLPQDIVVDAARLAAVRDWCQGFLFGIGLGGHGLTGRLSEQGQELLRDLAEYTRLDTDDVENSKENRAALIEIEEYLREGVMLIQDELSAPGREQGQESDEPH